MPSGSAHLKIEAGLLFGWTALAAYLLSKRAITPDAVVSFTFAYAFSMLFLSPDLDLAKSRAFKRWGIARWIWIPYAFVFRHRGLSHHPIFGPMTRIAYLALIVALLATGVALAVRMPFRAAFPSAGIVLGALVGLYVPNLTHVLSDRICSAWRGRKRRRL
ncbi:MAG: DUF2227 family putative metal-binding protein [Candidatus Bipolaricaulia bacterium]